MNRWRKLGFRLITGTALGAAAVGVAVPGIPTAPFLLLAAWSASHHSPELEARLLANPRVGPHIRAWREERAISRRAKWAALITLAVSFSFTLFVVDTLALKLFIGGALGTAAVFLATRPEPSGAVPEPPSAS
ncbi:MAG: YbaN family protein [Pseudomonadales bacterium]